MGNHDNTERVFALSTPQDDFKTAKAPSGENYRQIVKEGNEGVKFTSPNTSNAGESTGSAGGTRTTKGRDDAEFSGTERATFQGLGVKAFDSFGNVETTTVAAGVYKHVFTCFDSHVVKTLIARTLAQKVAEPALPANVVDDYLYPSMTAESLAFMMPHSADKPNLMMEWAYRGSGKQTEPSGVQFFGTGKNVVLDSEFGEDYIHEASGKMKFNDAPAFGGSGYELECGFYEFKAAVANNLNTEIGYSAGCAEFQDGTTGSGAIRGEMPITTQNVSTEFTAKLTEGIKNNVDPNKLMKNGTPFSYEIEFLGELIDATNKHSAKFIFDKCVAQNVEYPEIDSVIGIKAEAELLYVDNVMPFRLELITNVADFSTFVKLS